MEKWWMPFNVNTLNSAAQKKTYSYCQRSGIFDGTFDERISCYVYQDKWMNRDKLSFLLILLS